MLITTASVRASETDDRIEAAAKKSYVFKTYLKNDAIKTESENGVVTLTGTVAETPTYHWPKTPWKVCPASKAWTTS